jgi:hypothetical protein
MPHPTAAEQFDPSNSQFTADRFSRRIPTVRGQMSICTETYAKVEKVTR